MRPRGNDQCGLVELVGEDDSKIRPRCPLGNANVSSGNAEDKKHAERRQQPHQRQNERLG